KIRNHLPDQYIQLTHRSHPLLRRDKRQAEYKTPIQVKTQASGPPHATNRKRKVTTVIRNPTVFHRSAVQVGGSGCCAALRFAPPGIHPAVWIEPSATYPPVQWTPSPASHRQADSPWDEQRS